jgi:hypothetical protein
MAAHSQTPADQLKHVLALDGPEFLGQAYLLMLGRPVDPDGFRNYDAQLRSGASKVSILAALRASKEGQAYGSNAPDLLAHLAQARSAVPSPITSLHGLLRINGSAFVDQGFVTIVGRLPDDDIRRRYIAKLNAGADKLQILLDLVESNVGEKAASTEFEQAIRNMHGGLYPVATNIDELLALDDIAFIDCAYKTLLARPPDPTGVAHYLQLIRAGAAKMRIVSNLCFSAEARRKPPSLPGLKRAIFRFWLACNPLTGWWYRPIAQVEGETPVERRIRVVENTLMRMLQERERESSDWDAAADDVADLLRTLTNRQSV